MSDFPPEAVWPGSHTDAWAAERLRSLTQPAEFGLDRLNRHGHRVGAAAIRPLTRGRTVVSFIPREDYPRIVVAFDAGRVHARFVGGRRVVTELAFRVRSNPDFLALLTPSEPVPWPPAPTWHSRTGQPQYVVDLSGLSVVFAPDLDGWP